MKKINIGDIVFISKAGLNQFGVGKSQLPFGIMGRIIRIKNDLWYIVEWKIDSKPWRNIYRAEHLTFLNVSLCKCKYPLWIKQTIEEKTIYYCCFCNGHKKEKNVHNDYNEV